MPLPNAPIPLSQVQSNSGVSMFPSDLLSLGSGGGAGGGSSATPQGQFYVQIEAKPASQIMTGLVGAGGVTGTPNVQSSGFTDPTGGVYLPLPKHINDINISAWQDMSVLDYIPIINEWSKIVRGAGDIFGRLSGSAQTVNPFLYMLYKGPRFREFTFQWILAPNSSAETTALRNIIGYLKTASYPRYFNNFILEYPYLLLIKISPVNFLFRIKPCCIMSVEVDYAGSGENPSFFTGTFAPTIVSLTLHVKEFQIIVRDDIASESALTSGMSGN
jgi:hypothetical protein